MRIRTALASRVKIRNIKETKNMRANPTAKRTEQENSVRTLKREFITSRDAAVIYDMERQRVVKLAGEAGALYRLSESSVLIKKSVLDKYLEKFHVKAGQSGEDQL